MRIDRAAGFAILALVLALVLSLAPAAVVKAQTIIQPDSLQSGATTPEKLNKQIRQGAATQQASGTPAARYGVYTLSWPKDAAERDELASYAVVMVTVVTQTQAELPLQRVYLATPDGKKRRCASSTAGSARSAQKLSPIRNSASSARMRSTRSRVPRRAVPAKCVSTSPSIVSASF